jgi:hypothetical protein
MISYNMNLKILYILVFSAYRYSIAQPTQTPFKIGEKLEYKIHYGPIDAGIAELNVGSINNQHQFIAKGRSTGIFKLFFKVDDFYQSQVNPITLKPNYFFRDINEGGYEKIEKVFFNYEKNQAESTRDTISLIDNTQDILSIFYYLRAQNHKQMEVDSVIALQVYLDDKFMCSNLRYLGKDSIKTKFGLLSSTKWAPELAVGRIFKDPEDLVLWISDDLNKIPLRLEAKIRVGSIKMDLVNFEGLQEPLGFMSKKK